jgi:hypothetical protein
MDIKIGVTALIALSLDDTVLQSELGVKVTRAGKIATISGSLEDLATVLDDLYSRSQAASGWDQPRSWQQACKRAFDSAKSQLESFGCVVTIERRNDLGTERVTITLNAIAQSLQESLDRTVATNQAFRELAQEAAVAVKACREQAAADYARNAQRILDEQVKLANEVIDDAIAEERETVRVNANKAQFIRAWSWLERAGNITECPREIAEARLADLGWPVPTAALLIDIDTTFTNARVERQQADSGAAAVHFQSEAF